MQTGRPATLSPRGMVTSPHSLASAAGGSGLAATAGAAGLAAGAGAGSGVFWQAAIASVRTRATAQETAGIRSAGLVIILDCNRLHCRSK